MTEDRGLGTDDGQSIAGQPEFIFRSDDHTYWLGSKRLLSVTEVLNRCGLIYQADEAALKRGRIVHECCRLLAEGRLDWSTCDERIIGYVVSYRKFLDHTKFAAASIEKSYCDLTLGFAGTFDVFYDSGWLLDLKTGSAAKWHMLQTAAYHHLNIITPSATTAIMPRRGCLYLQADGELARLHPHNDRDDWKGFLTCLNYLRVKEKYGS